jgi:hypothetical protein
MLQSHTSAAIDSDEDSNVPLGTDAYYRRPATSG